MRHERTKARPTTPKGDRQIKSYPLQAPLTVIAAPAGSVPTGVKSLANCLSVYLVEPLEGTPVAHHFHIFSLLEAISIPPHWRFIGADGSSVGNDFFHVFYDPEGGAE